MKPSLTDILCTHCALCCDGSLFADVELASIKEADGLQILGLEVDDDDAHGVMLLPCGALHGTRCSIYAYRPATCRSFECGLLQDARSGTVSVTQAQESIAGARKQIGRVRELLTQLGHPDARLPLKERCADALARDPDASPAVNRKRARLEAEMAAVEAIVRTTFLGGGRR